MAARGLTVVDRVGQRIGRLVVQRRAPNKPEGNLVRASWWCRCDCGNDVIVTGASLNKALKGKGGTRSCGCLMKEKPTKHGRSGASIYGTWRTMLQRCTNPKNPAYANYGGRGITVCDEWKDFKKFYADMGDRPPGRTLDRVDNSQGYSKDNCRWATCKQQGNNRRSNTVIVFNGVRKTLAEWADHIGVSSQCLRGRLNAGWPIEKTMTTHSSRNSI